MVDRATSTIVAAILGIGSRATTGMIAIQEKAIAKDLNLKLFKDLQAVLTTSKVTSDGQANSFDTNPTTGQLPALS